MKGKAKGMPLGHNSSNDVKKIQRGIYIIKDV